MEYALDEGRERELRFLLAVCIPSQRDNRGMHGLLVRALSHRNYLADDT
jgi:hypothetical protein